MVMAARGLHRIFFNPCCGRRNNLIDAHVDCIHCILVCGTIKVSWSGLILYSQPQTILQCTVRIMLSRTPPSMLDGEEKPYKYRLETIGHAMSWIKDELVSYFV